VKSEFNGDFGSLVVGNNAKKRTSCSDFLSCGGEEGSERSSKRCSNGKFIVGRVEGFVVFSGSLEARGESGELGGLFGFEEFIIEFCLF
jgi:hypothetical protein